MQGTDWERFIGAFGSANGDPKFLEPFSTIEPASQTRNEAAAVEQRHEFTCKQDGTVFTVFLYTHAIRRAVQSLRTQISAWSTSLGMAAGTDACAV